MRRRWRRLVCAWRGHVFELRTQQGLAWLHCVDCDTDSPGWEVV